MPAHRLIIACVLLFPILCAACRDDSARADDLAEVDVARVETHDVVAPVESLPAAFRVAYLSGEADEVVVVDVFADARTEEQARVVFEGGFRALDLSASGEWLAILTDASPDPTVRDERIQVVSLRDGAEVELLPPSLFEFLGIDDAGGVALVASSDDTRKLQRIDALTGRVQVVSAVPFDEYGVAVDDTVRYAAIEQSVSPDAVEVALVETRSGLTSATWTLPATIGGSHGCTIDGRRYLPTRSGELLAVFTYVGPEPCSESRTAVLLAGDELEHIALAHGHVSAVSGSGAWIQMWMNGRLVLASRTTGQHSLPGLDDEYDCGWSGTSAPCRRSVRSLDWSEGDRRWLAVGFDTETFARQMFVEAFELDTWSRVAPTWTARAPEDAAVRQVDAVLLD